MLLLLMFQHDVKGEGSHRVNKRCERKAERESQRDETCVREGGGEGGDGEAALKQTKRRKNPSLNPHPLVCNKVLNVSTFKSKTF